MATPRFPSRTRNALPRLGEAVMFRRSPAHHPEPGTVVGRCFGAPQIEIRDDTRGGFHRLAVDALVPRKTGEDQAY